MTDVTGAVNVSKRFLLSFAGRVLHIEQIIRTKMKEDNTNLSKKLVVIMQIIDDEDTIVFDCEYGDFKITKLKSNNKPQPSSQFKRIQINLKKLRKLC